MEISSSPTKRSTRFAAEAASINPATASRSEPRYSGVPPPASVRRASGRQAMSTITAPIARANQRPKADNASGTTGAVLTKNEIFRATSAGAIEEASRGSMAPAACP